MITKRKISLTIDKELAGALEEAANEYKMAKSQLAQEAFRLWLKMKTEAKMEQGYEEMAIEDEEFSELTFNAQREIING